MEREFEIDASVQYDDWKRTVALDDPHRSEVLYEATGLDRDEWRWGRGDRRRRAGCRAALARGLFKRWSIHVTSPGFIEEQVRLRIVETRDLAEGQYD